MAHLSVLVCAVKRIQYTYNCGGLIKIEERKQADDERCYKANSIGTVKCGLCR